MGYYQTWLKKQEEKKKLQNEKNKDYNRKNAREYYWRHREEILEKNKIKRLYTNQYYKEWYEKNKEECNRIRNKKKNNNNNYVYKPKNIKNNNKTIQPIKQKVYTAKDFILFG